MHHLLRITYDLLNKEISSMGQDKGLLFSKGIIIGFVDPETALIDELVLCLPL